MILFFFASCTTDKEYQDTALELQNLPNTGELALSHLDSFFEIAQINNGNRTTGSSGYDASVEYVQSQLEGYGYSVEKQEFFVPTFVVLSPPNIQIGTNSAFDTNLFSPLVYSGSGNGVGILQEVDVIIPPQAPNSSTSGCQAEDFHDFIFGGIALIQRGSCTFWEKAKNAQEAGAIAVIIFNEGQNGRQDKVDGTLGEVGITIPVVGTSYDTGLLLLEHIGEEISFDVQTSVENLPSYNVIAEFGEGADILMVGAHLDSVPSGPGINDNASGSASILAVAQRLAAEHVSLDKKIRFAFWGAEELGLLGSFYYTESLESSAVSQISAYLNFDMVGSPNFIRMVYDGDGSESALSGPLGSAQIEEVFKDVFREKQLSFTETVFDGRSDYAGFIALNIPSGGLFSGAEGTMTIQQAENFEGEASVSYDSCYHQECDDRDNINEEGFISMVEVIEEVIRVLGNTEIESQQSFAPRVSDSLVFEPEILQHNSGCHIEK